MHQSEKKKGSEIKEKLIRNYFFWKYQLQLKLLVLGPNWTQVHQSTNYGRPMKPFFIEIQNFWAWADRANQANIFWGIFGQTISTHFDTVSPLFMFSIIQPLFLQKSKPLYPHPKYLGCKELGI